MVYSNILLLLKILLVFRLFGFINCQNTSSTTSVDMYRCKQKCYQKLIQDWHHCMDFEECKKMGIIPPNINNYIPSEAFSFLCWNNCDQTLGPFTLSIQSASKQGSILLIYLVWDQAITNSSKQCLVTWEVAGGGLMGNLLTDSSTVELSLWSDTTYNVQVTCKNKKTGRMQRSYKLIVDASKLSTNPSILQQSIYKNQNILPNIPKILATDTLSNDNQNMDIIKTKQYNLTGNENTDFSRILINKENTNGKLNNNDNTKNYLTVQQISSILRKKLKSDNLNITNEILQTNIIYGIIVACLVFIIVLLVCTVILRIHRISNYRSADKQRLIENEIKPGYRTLHV